MQRLKDVDKSPSRFPIGFWATGLNLDAISEDMTNDWKEAGFTLVHGPRFDHTPERAEKMKQVLNWAHERDIKVIIADSRTRAPRPSKDSNRIQQVSEDYRRAVQSAHAEYGSHPATFGYFINDEPQPTNFRATCECSKIVRDIAPDKQPFINHYPWWSTLHKDYNYLTFEEFIDDFLRMSAVRFLSYDCYQQTIPAGEPGYAWGMEMFFNSLYQYGATARRHGIDLWNIILSTPHLEYIVPSEDIIRWQFNCTIAHGGKGVFYYTFYTPGTADFRNGPINEFGERTEVFSWLKRTNRRFLETYGDLFLELELKKASHAGCTYGSVPAFEPDDLILAVEAKNIHGNGVIKGHPFVVSRFSCPRGGQYVMVVNNSLERSARGRVILRGADLPVWSYEWPSGERPVDPVVVKEKNHLEISTCLAPGQEILYRIGVKLS
ncbi:MAG: hypothetical protein NT011_02970 [Kiritimatiellaeota bacterium]|nr:hypothetical protein [Kiritimatiellota bacterium]